MDPKKEEVKTRPKINVALKKKEIKSEEPLKEESGPVESKKEEAKTKPKIDVALKNKESKAEEPKKEKTEALEV